MNSNMRKMYTEEQIAKLVQKNVLSGEVEIDGDLSITGDLDTDGDVSGDNITGNSIIENMSGYSFVPALAKEGVTINLSYVGAVKNGNKLTLCIFGDVTRTDTVEDNYYSLGRFVVPQAIMDKLYPAVNNWLEMKQVYHAITYNSGNVVPAVILKQNDGLYFNLYSVNTALYSDTKYYFRFEITFLLSDSLVS